MKRLSLSLIRDEKYGGLDRENSRDIAAGFEGDKGAERK